VTFRKRADAEDSLEYNGRSLKEQSIEVSLERERDRDREKGSRDRGDKPNTFHVKNDNYNRRGGRNNNNNNSHNNNNNDSRHKSRNQSGRNVYID
jgi:hypothetical protein